MADRCDDVVAELEKGMEGTVAFFRSLPADKLGVRVYQEGAS